MYYAYKQKLYGRYFMKVCCFTGHRIIKITPDLKVNTTIEVFSLRKHSG